MAVLLRAVNLGGHGRLEMARLRSVAVDLGCEDVATYLQSGNLVVTSTWPEAELLDRLSDGLARSIGSTTDLMARRADEWAAVLAANPYLPVVDGSKLHVAFCHEPPGEALAGIEGDGREQFTVVGREVYLSLPDGFGRSKLAARVTRVLKTNATMRNWNTVRAMGPLLGLQ